MKNVYIIVGFFILSLMVLTVTIYWLFVDRKIKDKKKLLAWLPPITIVVSHTILGCFCINAMVSIIVAFAIDTELMHPSAVTALFMAYAGSLLVLHTLSFCLRISIKREEKQKYNRRSNVVSYSLLIIYMSKLYLKSLYLN